MNGGNGVTTAYENVLVSPRIGGIVDCLGKAVNLAVPVRMSGKRSLLYAMGYMSLYNVPATF